MRLSRRRIALPCLAVAAAAALLLAGCGSSSSSTSNTSTTGSSSSGSITVVSVNGTHVMTGDWVRCNQDTGPTVYRKTVESFSGSSYVHTEYNGLTQANCSDFASVTPSTVTISVTVPGQKSVQWSADDGVTAATAPAGLSSPVTASEIQATVTASSDPVGTPVGSMINLVWFIDDRAATLVLYESTNQVGTDGYSDYLDVNATDTFTQ